MNASAVSKLRNEIKAVALAGLYFGTWIGVLIILKELVLAEYQIEFRAWSLVLIGTLVLAKVVLVLEHVPLGAWIRTRPALVDVILRTALYALGVFVVLVLEKAFEAGNASTLPSATSIRTGSSGWRWVISPLRARW